MTVDAKGNNATNAAFDKLPPGTVPMLLKPENKGKKRGVAAYFCHNSYAAHVIDLQVKNGAPIVDQVTSAMDCGVVINPDAASNMVEGAVTDGIGNALYGALTMKDGKPDQTNFHQYHVIRQREAPKKIDVHFVQNDIDPTGAGDAFLAAYSHARATGTAPLEAARWAPSAGNRRLQRFVAVQRVEAAHALVQMGLELAGRKLHGAVLWLSSGC